MRKFLLAMVASAVAVAAFTIAGAATGGSAPVQYTVAFNNPSGLPADVDQMVAKAGGTITTRIPEIGGIGVVSSDPNFMANLNANSSVKAVATSVEASVGPTMESSDLDAQIADAGNNGGTYSPTGSDAQPMPDSLGSEQWDKKKLNATTTGSYAIQRGNKAVHVFVIDTGADTTHIDVAANLDLADSRSFVPSEPFIQDLHGHGTWTISAVGAPINGVGISGVAPNVTLVSGKVLSGAGSGLFLWTDQALVYAGLKHFDIVSASLGGYIPKCGNKTDNCDHPDFILLNRATQFARSNGVLPIAAAANNGFDMSAGSFFRSFIEAPGEVAGWVTVGATGYRDEKAFYSNYGTPIDVSAPGGSTRNYSGVPGSAGPECAPHGSLCRLIGAWSSTASSAPSNPVEQCTGPGGTPPCFQYGYVQGTSMATPNTAGVAALIISQYGDFSPGGNPNKIHMSPTAVESILQITANNQPCPTPKTVVQGADFAPFVTATCQGDTGNNTFFGKGIVDAMKAITFHG
jgi:lantibiotic leader peptide-processing serine protease